MRLIDEVLLNLSVYIIKKIYHLKYLFVGFLKIIHCILFITTKYELYFSIYPFLTVFLSCALFFGEFDKILTIYFLVYFK